MVDVREEKSRVASTSLDWICRTNSYQWVISPRQSAHSNPQSDFHSPLSAGSQQSEATRTSGQVFSMSRKKTLPKRHTNRSRQFYLPQVFVHQTCSCCNCKHELDSRQIWSLDLSHLWSEKCMLLWKQFVCCYSQSITWVVLSLLAAPQEHYCQCNRNPVLRFLC